MIITDKEIDVASGIYLYQENGKEVAHGCLLFWFMSLNIDIYSNIRFKELCGDAGRDVELPSPKTGKSVLGDLVVSWNYCM